MAIKSGDLKRAAPLRPRPSLQAPARLGAKALAARRKFLRLFPKGFADETYLDSERNGKWDAYEKWCAALRRNTFRSLIDCGEYEAIAQHAITIESRTDLLFSVEKMAIRDAVQTREGAKAFAMGLFAFLHGGGSDQERFETWLEVVSQLPRKQTRVLTWPIVTVFGFIAQPDRHIFLKPNVTRRAAEAYGCNLDFASPPNWRTYVSLLEFAEQVREEQSDLCPRDMIDLQSFMWVQGSDKYD